jgi:AraC family transcriptional regulator
MEMRSGAASVSMAGSTQIIKCLDSGGLILTDLEHPPYLECPPHSHDLSYFGVVLHGSYTETVRHQVREIRGSVVEMHPSGEVHSFKIHDEPVRCLIVQMRPWWVDRVREHSPIVDKPEIFEGGQVTELALKLYSEFREMDDVSPLAMEGLALSILAEASRMRTGAKDRRTPRWLVEARELVHERFSENLSLDEIAQTVGVHPVHLARAFRERYRCTVGEYVRHRRVEYACRQITGSEQPFVEVASNAGFSDQSHFSRTFKRMMGMTPAQYRELFGRR